MSEQKKENPVLIMGPQISETERQAVRIDTEGVHHGVISSETNQEGTLIQAKHLGSNIYEVIAEHRTVAEQRTKPTIVNSSAFKSNWETIFGKKVEAYQS